jgi:uncharacterized protein YqgC (DUF456 family)
VTGAVADAVGWVPAAVGSVSVSAPDLVTVVAFLLLLAGVAGAVLPAVPSAVLSVAGVLVYWWGSGFTDPGPFVLAALVLAGVLAAAADWFGGAVAARVGGASTTSALLGGAVGLVLLFVAGPLGVLVGATGTVFLVEYRKREDARAGAAAAGAYLLGFLASAVVQAVLAVSILLAMVAVAL